MKNNLTAFLILLLLLCPDVIMAKSAEPLASRIAAIESTNETWSDISSDFEQKTFVSLLGKTVTRKGTLKIKKGGKLRISYKGEDKKDYVCDGTTLWIYTPGDAASLQTYAVDKESIPKEALSFLSGFGKLRKEFKISESDAFSGHAEGYAALHLVPSAKSEHYKSLDTLFGPDNLLSELVINNISGNISRYVFKDTKRDQNLPDGIFTLSAGKATPDTLPE